MLNKENIEPSSSNANNEASPQTKAKSGAVLAENRSPSPTAEQRIAEKRNTGLTEADESPTTGDTASLSPAVATEQQSEVQAFELKNRHLLFEDTRETAESPRRSPFHLSENFLFKEPLSDDSSSFEYLIQHKNSPRESPLCSPVIAPKKAEQRTTTATVSSPLSHSENSAATEDSADEELDEDRLESLQQELKEKEAISDKKKVTLQQLRRQREHVESELTAIDKRLEEVKAMKEEIADYEARTQESKLQFEEMVELMGQSSIVKEIDRKEAIINELLNRLSEVKYKLQEFEDNRQQKDHLH